MTEDESVMAMIEARARYMDDDLMLHVDGKQMLAWRNERIVTLTKALIGLRIGGEAGCWCQVAIGNPMYDDHTAACKAARAALEAGGK